MDKKYITATYIDIVEENKSVTNAVSTVVFFEFLSKECSGYGL